VRHSPGVTDFIIQFELLGLWPLVLLKIIENPKELVFLWVIFVDDYNINIKTDKKTF
jgi:hypothetical protein